MADLLTHGAAAVLFKAASRWEMAPIFVVGTFLPDVASRVPSIGLGLIHVHLMRIPEWLLFAWEPMHQPFGMLLVAYLLSMWFPVAVRLSIFTNIVGGMALHLLLDVFQSHHGAGYMLMFPFKTGAFEFGWMGSEATVPFALPLGLVSAWLIYKRKQALAVVQEQ